MYCFTLAVLLLIIYLYIQLLLEADYPDLIDDVIEYMKHLHSSNTVTSASEGDAHQKIVMTTVEELLSVIAGMDIPEVGQV